MDRMHRMDRFAGSGFWIIPATFVAGAVVLAVLIIGIDRTIPQQTSAWFLFTGGPDGARDVLGTITGSMIAFTGLVFSITIVVLQLASAQFSPRILRTFLRDRHTQTVLGIYLATFTFALLVLASVRSPEVGEAFVPALGVSVSLLLVITSLAAFVHHIQHMGQGIRAVTIINNVASETRSALERLYPEAIGSEPAGHTEPPRSEASLVIESSRRPGVVTRVDGDAILRLATAHDVVIRLEPMIGDFVPTGSTLFEVWGRADALDRHALERCVSLGTERTMAQDVAFGMRQLVDIAERALSPAMNDPTTAVQSIDHLHDLLRRLSKRPFPSSIRVDEDGMPRLIVPRHSWEDYVNLALEEIRQYGERSIQVSRRVRALLLDLLSVAGPERRGVLELHLRLLDRAIDRGFPDREDKRLAREADEQGLE